MENCGSHAGAKLEPAVGGKEEELVAALFLLSNFGSRKRVFKTDRDGRAFADIVHQRGAETCDAGSALMANARVHDTD
jgi:hypothetical protein